MASSSKAVPEGLEASVAQLLAQPDSAAYAALFEAVESGEPTPAELARALLQVASALVQTAARKPLPEAEADRASRESERPSRAAACREEQEALHRAIAETQERLSRAVFEAAAPAALHLPTLQQRRQAGLRVRVQEALDVATLLAEALQVLDLRPLGKVGEVTAYDPRYHVPRYKKHGPLKPGTTVRVEKVGYTGQGRVLRPAQVVPVASGTKESPDDARALGY
jgi:molecular chaperone GrpE (heat shock protein)